MRANGNLAALAAAAALFCCCVSDNDKTAGVDEFPNSIYARVNGFLDEGKKSEAIAAVPSVTDDLAIKPDFKVTVDAGAPGALKASAARAAGDGLSAAAADAAASGPLHGLAKGAADTGCAATITFTDTLKVPVNNPVKVTVSNAILCVDTFLLDGIQGNETLLHAHAETTFKTGRVETADISDADGDGKVNATGSASKAGILFTATENGVSERTRLVMGAGPDADFDTEQDNLVYAAAWTKLAGADTLGTAVYTDADGDGVAIDNSKASLVDLDFYQKGPSADHPDAVWSRASLRLVVRYQVEAKEVKRAHFETENAAGRREIGEVLDRQGGPDIDMADTVQARFLTYGAPADSLDSSEVRLTMKLGRDFDAKTDDSVYAIDARTVKRSGEEKAAHFSFQSIRPIPSGADPVAGNLSMELVYADGTSLNVDGEITPGTLNVTVQDRQGKKLHVVWDRQGRGISSEALP